MHARLAAALAILAALSLDARAQVTLADRVSEGNAVWMLGTWEGQTESGDTFTQTFSWDLEKHMILSHWKGSSMETKGMILLDPESGEVEYLAASNRGGLLKGVWQPEGDALVLTMTAISQEGRTWKAAVVHRQVDANTMKVEFFPFDPDGNRASEPAMSTELKKKS